MPVTSHLLKQVNDYEKQGYGAAEILDGISSNPKYADVGEKIKNYRAENDDGFILDSIKKSKVTTADIKETPEWAGKYPNLYGVLGATKEIARFGAEVAGMIGGGIAGAPLGPAGVVAGAGLGYAGVKTVEREFEGDNPDPSLVGRFKTAAKDVATGAIMETGGAIVGKVISKIAAPLKNSLTDYVTGKLNKDTAEYLKVAESKGYTPTAAEIAGGKNRLLSILEGGLSYYPASAGRIGRARIENLDKLVNLRSKLLGKDAESKAIEVVGQRIQKEAKKIIESTRATRAKISKENEEALTGKLMADINTSTTAPIREYGLSENLKGFYDSTGLAPTISSTAGKEVQDVMASEKNNMYSSASEKLSKARDMLGSENVNIEYSRTAADNIIREELQSAHPDTSVIRWARQFSSKEMSPEIKGLFDSPEKIKRNTELYDSLMSEVAPKARTWTGLDLDTQKLGEAARKANMLEGTPYSSTRGSTTRAGRSYLMLKRGIEEDMASAASKSNKEAYDLFTSGKEDWYKAKQLFDDDALKIMKKSPEDVFNTVVNPGEVANIRKLKEIIGDKAFKPLKDLFTQKIISIDKNGILDVAKTKQNINKYGESFGEVFSKEEQKSIYDLVKKSSVIEQGYQKTKALDGIFSKNADNTININTTKRNIINKKAELEKYYTPEEISKINGFVNTLGKANVRSLARNKKEGMEFLQTMADYSSPEKIVNAIVRPNNTINIRYMKRLLGPERAKDVETKFVENYLLKINEHGYYKPGTSAKNWNNYEKPMKSLMDPGTYKEVSELMLLNKHAGQLESMASNPSQTGQVMAAYDTGKQLLGSVSSLLTGVVFAGAGAYSGHGKEDGGVVPGAVSGAFYGLAVAFSPNILARMYLSPAGRKFLSVGYTIPAGGKEGVAFLSKMAMLAGISHKTDKEGPREGVTSNTLPQQESPISVGQRQQVTPSNEDMEELPENELE